MGMITEFKEFAMRGNVIDLAVGIIVGGAFGKIVTSMVNDMLMPIVGLLTGGIDFKGRFYALDGARPIVVIRSEMVLNMLSFWLGAIVNASPFAGAPVTSICKPSKAMACPLT